MKDRYLSAADHVVYPESRFFPSWLPDPGFWIPDPGQIPDSRFQIPHYGSQIQPQKRGARKKISVLPFFVAIYIFEQVKKIYKPTNYCKGHGVSRDTLLFLIGLNLIRKTDRNVGADSLISNRWSSLLPFS